MLRALVFTVLVAIATDAHALAWPVVPADTIEPEVSLEYWLTEDTPTGTALGEPALFVGPLEPGVAREVLADEYVGTGRTICLHALAVSGAMRGQEVSRCDRFPRLDPPVLSAPR